MTRFFSAAVFAFILLMTLAAAPLHAQEFGPPHHDDNVSLDLSAEDWVTTKTAHVEINVDAAVSSGNSGAMRADMFKAVNQVAKADWRLTSFDRSQDQTGLERWSTTFEARLPESELNGLGEAVKKLSKAGMQLSVGDIDFSPTLEESEAARAALRVQIYKQADEQLASLNAAIPGRDFRIADIDFTGRGMPFQPMPPRPMQGRAMMATAMAPPIAVEGPISSSPDQRSEKVTLAAHVVFAAAVPHDAAMPVPERKR